MSSKATSTPESGPPHSVPDPRHQELSLGEYELSGGRRAPFILTWAEVKLLGIAGVSTWFSLIPNNLLTCLFPDVGWVLP